MTGITPINREITFQPNEIIVSKTDLKGRITYCNDVFMRLAGYTETELLGAPHSIIRHPDMPRCVFKLLWDTLTEEREIFAYVKNLTKDGSYYWVLAHATPSYDIDSNLVGYHSNRRVADKTVLKNTIIPLYEELLAIEASESNRQEGMIRAHNHLIRTLKNSDVNYDEFVARLAFAA